MDRRRVREIGLFFLLGFMEEKVAMAAASRALAQLKSQYGESSKPVPPAEVIRSCRAAWKVYRKQRQQAPRSQTNNRQSDKSRSWTVPDGFDLSVWSRYQKDAPDEDVMAILFTYIFEFSDSELAEGFQTSIGTIRYRLGKGVRQLGLVVRGAGSREGVHL